MQRNFSLSDDSLLKMSLHLAPVLPYLVMLIAWNKIRCINSDMPNVREDREELMNDSSDVGLMKVMIKHLEERMKKLESATTVQRNSDRGKSFSSIKVYCI